MHWSKSSALALTLILTASSLESAAQPSAPVASNRLVPHLHVFALPGFRTRAPGQGATGVITLGPDASSSAQLTLQADASGPCTNSLQMPAAPRGTRDATASAEWRVHATPVSTDGEQATVDVRWERRVPRPGLLLEGDLVQERRLVLRDRGRGILDVVRRAGDAPGVCDSFAIGIELRFGSPADAQDAGLGYDLWLIDRASGDAVGHARSQAEQGEDATYAFAPQRLTGAAGDVRVTISGTVTGRARNDGSIDLTFDTNQAVARTEGIRVDGGRKRMPVRPGETIEFEMPDALKTLLPDDLRQHDYALRVTTERLW
jgi:hypothetical protein